MHEAAMDVDGLVVDDEAIRWERYALRTEGADVSAIEDELDELESLLADDPLAHQEEARALLERARKLPVREGFPYEQPGDLEAIRDLRPDGPRSLGRLDGAALEDALHGAWLGRCAGCLLGKPVEGWSAEQLRTFLEDAGRYPLDGYLPSPDSVDAPVSEYEFVPDEHAWIDRVEGMPVDDDLNYTVLGLDAVDENGADFTSRDVADAWLGKLPAYACMTAERIAYRNFLDLVAPPESGRRYNWFREAIGAQIRADPYGYVALGEPELAAELAWRDARISHTENGVYGSMWVAAMCAAAPFVETPRDVVDAGLAEIPETCRLADAVEDVLAWRAEGIHYHTAVERHRDRWPGAAAVETQAWLDVVPNAAVVAIGLLWGEDDLGTAITRTVQAALDTDCNGATVGSIVGLRRGAADIPGEWIDPLRDTLATDVRGHAEESISGLAARTADVHRRVID